jgi:hypothetical protein
MEHFSEGSCFNLKLLNGFAEKLKFCKLELRLFIANFNAKKALRLACSAVSTALLKKLPGFGTPICAIKGRQK